VKTEVTLFNGVQLSSERQKYISQFSSAYQTRAGMP
jgi:hypothetical protein